MGKVWLHSVRLYIKLGLFFYYKKIDVYNAEHIPKNKPVLLLSNHQNALLDALIIGTHCKRFPWFLTRASVFEKPLIAKLLKRLQMLPVYRVRDGWNNLSSNKAVFQACSEKLKQEEMVAVFPEGNHSLKRTVRPLSKGFSRIVFDTLHTYPETNLELLPIGLNYQNAVNYADSVALYFGETIAAKDFVFENRHKGVVKLKAEVQSRISQLTTHISSEDYDKTIKTLKNLDVNFLNPKLVNKCIAGHISINELKKTKSSSLLKKGLKVLLICNSVLPYLVWKFIAEPKIKDLEFISTFRFAIAITLVPFWLFLITLLLLLLFGFKIALLYFLGSLFLAWLAVKL